MRPKLFSITPFAMAIPVIAILALLLAFRIHEKNSEAAQLAAITAYKKKNIISCSPDWDQLRKWIEETDVPPLPGVGNLKWRIKTNNDSAQFYFNQGLNTYYGFHIIESRASFQKAAKLDPTSPMIWWGIALSFGPNINDVEYPIFPEALDAVDKAIKLSVNATEKEKLLIESQRVRYSNDSSIGRTTLNQQYADKMKEAYQKHPNDVEIAALYADALMLQHPWDLWSPDGKPKPWTPAIREILEKGLAKNPDHSGLIHYYIHVMEPSPFAALAKPGADKLGQLAPGLSHLVHMPSHIYLRTGDYRKGALVNENALNTYNNYSQLYAPVTGNSFLYAIHNIHMQTNNAMMEGDSAYSIRSALATQKSIPADYLEIPGAMGNYLQYIYMTPVLTYVRFGNWTELLAMAQPGSSQVYANVLYHFGRGMAYAHQADQNTAKQELDKMKELMKDSVLSLPFTPFSSAIDGARVAAGLLEGSIALLEKNYTNAIAALSGAVTTEESMVYNEPRDWMLNPKHYLGNAYLQAKQYNAARQVFQDDLIANNENGWALFGLFRAYEGEGIKTETEKALGRFKKAFAKADIDLKSSIHF